MGTPYSAYNLIEIKHIIRDAVQMEMLIQGQKEEVWDALLSLQTRLYDMLGIED